MRKKMDRKTVVIGIVGAAVILLATTVATACLRGCSAGTIDGGNDAQQEQVKTSEEARANQSPEQVAQSILIGNVWIAKDATLTIKDGRYVETKGEDMSFITFDVDTVNEQDGGYALTLKLDATQKREAKESLLLLEMNEQGVWTVSSDDFAYRKTYTQSQNGRNSIVVVNLTTDLLNLIDNDEAGIKAALEAYAESNVPGAAKATWSGEVLVDFNAQTITTTFSCDDPAKTLITVVRSTDGRYSITG